MCTYYFVRSSVWHQLVRSLMEYDIILHVCMVAREGTLFESPLACLSNQFVGKLMVYCNRLGNFHLPISPWVGNDLCPYMCNDW